MLGLQHAPFSSSRSRSSRTAAERPKLCYVACNTDYCLLTCCPALAGLVPARPPARPAETDGKVVRTLVKLTLFRQFYIMVRAPLWALA